MSGGPDDRGRGGSGEPDGHGRRGSGEPDARGGRTTDPGSESAALRVAGLRVDLGTGRARREIVHGVDLVLGRGELLALIGPNGSGKSTLLRAVAGLVPSTGEITVAGGRAPGPLDLALMPQHPVLPDGMTVAEYVLLGRTPHLGAWGRESAGDRRAVASVLDRLGLLDYAGRRVRQLSGGEAQRVTLARALAQDAPVLLLDEPTSSLDIGAATGVLDLVDDLRRDAGLSVLVAIHDLSVAGRYADRLVLLDHGEVVATGTPDEVLTPERLSRVYGADLDVHRIDGYPVVVPRTR